MPLSELHHAKGRDPFDRDPACSASAAFDQNSGETVQASELATYATVLAQYHLHAESKFWNGRSLDAGTTLRRHVVVLGSTYIGKEANRWEEQFFTGRDLQAAVTTVARWMAGQT
ncbi:hypothetical protein [Methylobacterium goesingense]|uniref:Uncharacterized protein n=1 Tax=Methylobacterium goesingense TaxID=243690 RepID=A0ABV2LCW0_9HYPH|nr:hypothetical protein [Methylobacterium goesingense]